MKINKTNLIMWILGIWYISSLGFYIKTTTIDLGLPVRYMFPLMFPLFLFLIVGLFALFKESVLET